MKIGCVFLIVIAALLATGCVGYTGTGGYRPPDIIRNSSAAPPCDVISSTYDALDCIASQNSPTDDLFSCAGMANGSTGMAQLYTTYIQKSDYCYISLAVRTQNVSICERLGPSILKAYCWYWIAGVQKNVSICENLTPSSVRYAECCDYLAKKTGGNICKPQNIAASSFCSRINDSNDHDQCFRDAAMETDDDTLCDLILTFPTIRAECLYDLAVRHANLSLCVRIRMTGYTDACYSQVYSKIAEKKKDKSVCENLAPGNRDGCYAGVAVATQDISLCDLVTKDSIKFGHIDNSKWGGSWPVPGCYAKIAALKKMPSLCDRIPDQKLKDDCYSKAR